MKSTCILLLLLVTGVLCEKKLNLEDIERENHNHRLDPINDNKKPVTETLSAEESKYSSAKAEIRQAQHQRQQQQHQHQQQYHGPTTPSQELNNQAGDYTELSSYESFKYAQPQAQTYSQEKYAETEDTSAYSQQTSALPEQQQQQYHQQPQQQPQQQYYVQEARSNSPSAYDALQQQLYQQEVLVGNQLQTVQQKAASQKYTDAYDGKGTYYVNIPMSQLLAYYQNYGLVQQKSKNAEQQQQQISIPLYMPYLTQNQVYAPTKVTYQPDVQYVPSYPKHTQAVFTKTTKAAAPIHASPVDQSSVQQLPAATSHQQYSTPIELLMTPTYATAYQPQKYQQQIYVTNQQHPVQQTQYAHAQQQSQQQQQLVYETQANSAYSDIYNTPATSYVQDNSLYDQQSQHPQQQYYVPTALAEQLMTQILQEAGLQNSADIVHQTIKDEPQQSLNHDFTPPQYQAQKFRSNHEVTHLVPVAAENEGLSGKSIYSSVSSQPKSLLDSYVPSHVIHAQDANRYRERPIKLESGFLPSKINFIRSYKKRKTE